jgi:hypothetical protein
MRALGGSLNNPEALRKVMYDGVRRSADALDMQLEMYPEEFRGKVLGKAYTTLQEKRARFEKIYGPSGSSLWGRDSSGAARESDDEVVDKWNQ